MERVIKSHRLIRRVSDVQILVGGVLIDRCRDDDARDQQADDNLEGGRVNASGEEVPTGSRAVEIFEELAHRVQTKGLTVF